MQAGFPQVLRDMRLTASSSITLRPSALLGNWNPASPELSIIAAAAAEEELPVVWIEAAGSSGAGSLPAVPKAPPAPVAAVVSGAPGGAGAGPDPSACGTATVSEWLKAKASRLQEQGSKRQQEEEEDSGVAAGSDTADAQGAWQTAPPCPRQRQPHLEQRQLQSGQRQQGPSLPQLAEGCVGMGTLCVQCAARPPRAAAGLCTSPAMQCMPSAGLEQVGVSGAAACVAACLPGWPNAALLTYLVCCPCSADFSVAEEQVSG